MTGTREQAALAVSAEAGCQALNAVGAGFQRTSNHGGSGVTGRTRYRMSSKVHATTLCHGCRDEVLGTKCLVFTYNINIHTSVLTLTLALTLYP